MYASVNVKSDVTNINIDTVNNLNLNSNPISNKNAIKKNNENKKKISDAVWQDLNNQKASKRNKDKLDKKAVLRTTKSIDPVWINILSRGLKWIPIPDYPDYAHCMGFDVLLFDY